MKKHIQSAFCIFYPQNTFAETFGLVFAEENQLCTPVITDQQGAVTEVLSNTSQIVDTSDSNNVINRIKEWQQQGWSKVFLKVNST